MIPASNRPDLERVGQSAFTEVLDVLLSLPAIPRNPATAPPAFDLPDPITSTVQLAGPQLSATICVQLPRVFVAHAVGLLTGLEGAARDAVLDDTAGELANMVAGRVAAHLATHGCACTLGTPSVSLGAGLPVVIEPGTDQGRTVLFCEGHGLILEIQCRYPAA